MYYQNIAKPLIHTRIIVALCQNTHKCIHTDAYTHTYKHMYVHRKYRVTVWVRIHTYIHRHKHAYLHTYTYTYTVSIKQASHLHRPVCFITFMRPIKEFGIAKLCLKYYQNIAKLLTQTSIIVALCQNTPTDTYTHIRTRRVSGELVMVIVPCRWSPSWPWRKHPKRPNFASRTTNILQNFWPRLVLLSPYVRIHPQIRKHIYVQGEYQVSSYSL